MTTRRCPGEEHRRFDGLLGAWEGTRTGPAGHSVPVIVELTRILEGCAFMERVWAVEGGWEAFRVRAFEPVFTDAGPSRGPLTRTRREIESEAARGWVTEAADDPSGPWRVTSSVRLLEPLGEPFRP